MSHEIYHEVSQISIYHDSMEITLVSGLEVDPVSSLSSSSVCMSLSVSTTVWKVGLSLGSNAQHLCISAYNEADVLLGQDIWWPW